MKTAPTTLTLLQTAGTLTSVRPLSNSPRSYFEGNGFVENEIKHRVNEAKDGFDCLYFLPPKYLQILRT